MVRRFTRSPRKLALSAPRRALLGPLAPDDSDLSPLGLRERARDFWGVLFGHEMAFGIGARLSAFL